MMDFTSSATLAERVACVPFREVFPVPILYGRIPETIRCRQCGTAMVRVEGGEYRCPACRGVRWWQAELTIRARSRERGT